jgi:hypothetical protein
METFLIVLAVIALSWRPGAMRTAEPDQGIVTLATTPAWSDGWGTSVPTK